MQGLKGLTGGVFAVVADASGAIITRSTIQQYGVDGMWLPGLNSSRVDNWTANFGADAATNGRTLGIVQVWDPKNRFFTDIGQILTGVETIVGLVQAICAAVPDLCAVVGAALWAGDLKGRDGAWRSEVGPRPFAGAARA